MLRYIDVLLVNEEELLMLSSKNNLVDGVELLLKEGPSYIIVKRGGVQGCVIAQRDEHLKTIPAYKSNAICTLGSGDVFGGALVAMYVETGDMEYSVRFASCMVSCFIEDFDIERMPNKEAIKYYMGNRILIDFTSVRELTVYLAGPFFYSTGIRLGK